MPKGQEGPGLAGKAGRGLSKGPVISEWGGAWGELSFWSRAQTESKRAGPRWEMLGGPLESCSSGPSPEHKLLPFCLIKDVSCRPACADFPSWFPGAAAFWMRVRPSTTQLLEVVLARVWQSEPRSARTGSWLGGLKRRPPSSQTEAFFSICLLSRGRAGLPRGSSLAGAGHLPSPNAAGLRRQACRRCEPGLGKRDGWQGLPPLACPGLVTAMCLQIALLPRVPPGDSRS